jgi:hypothetical protein
MGYPLRAPVVGPSTRIDSEVRRKRIAPSETSVTEMAGTNWGV